VTSSRSIRATRSASDRVEATLGHSE